MMPAPQTYHLPNVGHLRIDWDAAMITAKVLGEDGGTKIAQTLPFRELLIS